ncbi:MAG: fibronectin type III-like domain-contianing protein, partial [Atopostipes sp.]|nr:fibronectin type III-like domain-contianing protein [Atopostipes sp.]
YINDRSAEIARPIKELKDFQQIELDAQEKKEFSFKLSLDDLKYTHSDLSHSADAGVFNVFIGTDSDAKKVGSFKLLQN